MTPGDEGPREAEQMAEQAVQGTTETAQAIAAEAATGLQSATAAIAYHAEKANREGARATSEVLGGTSDALGAARERLNAMAGSLPPASREMFRPFQSGGVAFGKGLESSYTTAMAGMAEFNSKAIAAWRSNAESTIRHWQSLASVKSLSEAIALSAEHTRQQLEAVTSQTRELSALATRIVRDAADPLKMTRS